LFTPIRKKKKGKEEKSKGNFPSSVGPTKGKEFGGGKKKRKLPFAATGHGIPRKGRGGEGEGRAIFSRKKNPREGGKGKKKKKKRKGRKGGGGDVS